MPDTRADHSVARQGPRLEVRNPRFAAFRLQNGATVVLDVRADRMRREGIREPTTGDQFAGYIRAVDLAGVLQQTPIFRDLSRVDLEEIVPHLVERRYGAGQTVWVVVASLVLIAALYQFFERTLYGKALRATAVNRVGARLMGISPALAGKLTFLLAAFIGALSGVLIAPITTIYYDTGFLIGLKGFVAAIIGGLASYPIAAAGAVAVGLLEAFSSFWASAYKEVIVFTLIIPVLLWRSLASRHVEEEE